MTFEVILEAAARQDWSEAVEWYAEREPAAGLRLNEDILAAIVTLTKQPDRFRSHTRLTRKARLLAWPYSIYFTVNTTYRELKVLAIWHGRRNPAELRFRLK